MSARGPIVLRSEGATYVDRGSLARLTGRSVNTIRTMPADRTDRSGRPLYDVSKAAAILSERQVRARN